MAVVNVLMDKVAQRYSCTALTSSESSHPETSGLDPLLHPDFSVISGKCK